MATGKIIKSPFGYADNMVLYKSRPLGSAIIGIFQRTLPSDGIPMGNKMQELHGLLKTVFCILMLRQRKAVRLVETLSPTRSTTIFICS